MSIACAIDLGTNSFRMLLAEVQHGHILPQKKELATVRLGENLGKTGMLSPAAIARGKEALLHFAASLAAVPSLQGLRICGTYALRQAANRQDFLTLVCEVLGRPAEIVSGEEEASLSLRGVLSSLKAPSYPLCLADVGGGSSEVLFQSTPGALPDILSLPIGAVGLTEEFGSSLPAMEQRLESLLTEAFRNFSVGGSTRLPSSLIACGGTATSLAVLSLGLRSYESALVQNHRINRDELDALYRRLSSLSPENRSSLGGISPKRGEIILAGTAIYRALLRQLALWELLVSDAGLLEGILLSSLD